MKQLDASARKFKSDKKVICIILNFDQMYTEDSLLFDISTLYKPQNYNVESLLLFGIDSFETFIYNYDSVDKLENLFDNYKDKSLKVHQIIENCDAIKDYFYEDIFYKETDAFIDVLKLSKMYHDKNQKMIKKSKVCRKIKNEKSKKDFACCLHKK